MVELLRPSADRDQEQRQGRPLQRLDSLTGLRIFAAVWVMLLHFRDVTTTEVWPIPLIDRFVVMGDYAVDLFFVLSGFILCHVYFGQFAGGLRRDAFRSFIGYRFARLYPVHVVTFATMVLLFFGNAVLFGAQVVDRDRYSIPDFLTSLTMTHAWSGTLTQSPTVTPNVPAWSISAEWFAYLLFPVLCLAVTRLRAFAPLAFSGVGFGLATTWHQVAESHLIRVMAGFLVGMAIHQISRRRAMLARMPFLGTVIVFLVVLWATVGPDRLEIALLLFAALILVLASERDWLCRILSTRTIVYLGEVSYAVYMVHWVVRVIVRAAADKMGVLHAIPPPLMVATYTTVTFAAAILLYHLVERPWRRRLRRLLTARNPMPNGEGGHG